MIAKGGVMKNRIKDVYLEIGHVLNSPERFGLRERMPKRLGDVLAKIRLELFDELRERGTEEDLLAEELSQDADVCTARGLTSTSFELPKKGT
jgi:hypothetical protein